MTIKDKSGKERLIAKYARVKPTFENYERGIAIFNDETEMFERYKEVQEWIPDYHVTHHPFLVRVNDIEYYYLTSEFGFSRVKPNLEDIANPKVYESFSCLQEDEKFNPDNPGLDRDPEGKLIWDWKPNTGPITISQQQSHYHFSAASAY
jgi:hypothetical protein